MNKWKYIKYKGNLAYYEKCEKCGFEHCCSSLNTQTFSSEIDNVYNFCPMCGDEKNNSNTSVEIEEVDL